ncbi:tubby-related protein 4 [Oncorhynchus kisutch]|uniref:tubby-related protein 4 n=1 Tax=Oncorhynchus kisutch TaxID=8019 RepID=UPI00099F8562|nr:tubby-related protein 4 [Oncorhynchus kisutch]
MSRNYEPGHSVGMLATVEHGPILCSDSNILCLSWKGRVPKSEKDKPVCQRRYHEEGWLATGNGRGVVGVTFTSSHCRRDRNTPQRINFNLRGHNSEVVLVRWNEPFQKLATCDMEGGIFVWIQYEGRWSVELVNDRGAQVSDFTWSHDGTQALIAYRDGFVLVGSVSGQRHWSSEINLESQITCGIWTPDDQQVLFGTADGQVIVMDCHGRMLAHVLLHESDGIVGMSWNCPCFLVEDCTESDTDSDDNPPQVRILKPLLTVSFISGDISLMNNYDDLAPTVIRSGLKDVEVQWCSQGDLLAAAGMERHGLPGVPSDPIVRNALVKFYNVQGEHIYTLETPAQRPITTICWGHRDSRLFLACGTALYVVRVEHRVASLQLLCQQGIASALREERDVGKLNMPSLLCSYVTTAFIPTIKPPIPDPNNIRDFVSYPTAGNERLHCTMKRAEDNPEAGGPCYTLYLEHLGGLVPILKGRRISKLRPEFIIIDPKTDSKADEVCVNAMISYMTDSCNCSDSSDIELSDEWVGKKSPKLSRGNGSPKLSRRNMESRKSPKMSRASQEGPRSPRLPTKKPPIRSPSLTRREMSMDGISEHNYLAQVTSNIWGTKFKIVGLASFLPANLGAVIYKTSLLHLQPRQMTIYLPEVRKISLDFMSLPVFNPNVFSEDEDDLPVMGPSGVTSDNPSCTVNIPIAPIHSPAQAMSPTQSIGLVQSLLANQNIQLDVLTNPTATASAAAAAAAASASIAGPDHGQNAVAAQYSGTLGRYSNPGQVIFNRLEMGPLLAGTLPPPPPPHHPPQQPQQQHSSRSRPPSFIDTDTLRSRPPSFLDAETSLEIQMRKVNPPPPYPGTIVSAATATTSTAPQTLITNCDNPNILVTADPCLKKDEFSLHPVGLQYQMGYERITTFDSSGNVEEVCRPRRRLISNQNTYAVQGMGGSATLKVTSSSDSKKVQLPYSSATLSRLSVPRYSIPSRDPPPYPDPANQVNINTTTLSPPQRMDSSHMIHATLRPDRRDVESRLKVSQMVDASRTLPTKSKINSAALALSYQQRVPTALYTCTQCSSNSSSTSVSVSGGGSSSSGIAGGTVVRQDFPPGKGAHHSTIIVHSKSTLSQASQSSYNLLSPVDNSRDRTVYVNSAFTEDETLSQQCRHLTLGEVSLTLKRPPPYQWDPNTAEEFWIPPEQTILAPPPPPTHKPPPPIIFSNTQHLDMTRLPFVLSTKPPSSPSTVTFPSGYQISMSPFPPGVGQDGSPLQSMQSHPPPCPPNEVVAPVPQFAQQDPNLVLPPGYPPSHANLACCPLPPMYPGAASCAGLQLHPVSLHPWNPYSLPMQDLSGSATLPSKSHQVLEKPVLSPPPPVAPPPPPLTLPPPPPSKLPKSKSPTEELAESASSFQEPSSLNESPVPDRQGSDMFSKKSRKRLDSRAEAANMTTVSEGKSKKEGRALSDFNSLISSPRLGGREKKKLKGQREQLNKTKKLNRTSTTSEFQDSSESEPELFISGDELMNQSQSSKKGWKSKRSLRMASELEEIKCRKANEREDRGLGSQGFIYVMANKQPLWNEATQVYQLDFGGRVTQESAKNFQIELDGRQVMQFGRIDGNAYILDFQYPFSAVQAFAVALANVTQRLK